MKKLGWLALALSVACAGSGTTDAGFDVLDASQLACTPQQLTTDPYNCGECGHACTFPNAQGLCVDGGCVQGPCQYGFVDVDGGDPGCEYGCIATEPPTEVCDDRDNDCNGQVDDGFNLAID